MIHPPLPSRTKAATWTGAAGGTTASSGAGTGTVGPVSGQDVTMRVPVTVRLCTQAPALQVSPVPQLVPSARKVWSVHAGAPELQSMVAVAVHGFVEVQAAPWVHDVHTPVVEQTTFVPQLVPAARKVRSVQIPPVLHSMVANAAQGFVEVQAAPSVQAMQAPPGEQTCPVPQLVPAARNVRSVHTGAPELHSMVAVAAQGFVEVQAAPWAHDVHAPVAEQTMSVPQLVPAARNVRSVHTGAPELHSTVELVAHGLGVVGVQAAPWVHDVQTPVAEQTMSVPQLVPAARNVRSVHMGAPELHSIVELVAQGFVEVQAAPWVHDVHAPAAEQTRFVPQFVPAARKVRSVHAGAPELHSMVAVAAQRFVEVQAAPWVQEVQTPVVEQTWSVPQLVPGARKVWSVHTGKPEPHSMVAAAAHGFVEVQAAPWTQALQTPSPQTRFDPQGVPFGRVPVSVHTGTPVVQEMAAV